MDVEALAVKYQESKSNREAVRTSVFASLVLNPSFPATKFIRRDGGGWNLHLLISGSSDEVIMACTVCLLL